MTTSKVNFNLLYEDENGNNIYLKRLKTEKGSRGYIDSDGVYYSHTKVSEKFLFIKMITIKEANANVRILLNRRKDNEI